MTYQLTPIPVKINGIFPTPVYTIKRDYNLTPKEEKEIKSIINEGMKSNIGNSS